MDVEGDANKIDELKELDSRILLLEAGLRSNDECRTMVQSELALLKSRGDLISDIIERQADTNNRHRVALIGFAIWNICITTVMFIMHVYGY